MDNSKSVCEEEEAKDLHSANKSIFSVHKDRSISGKFNIVGKSIS